MTASTCGSVPASCARIFSSLSSRSSSRRCSGQRELRVVDEIENFLRIETLLDHDLLQNFLAVLILFGGSIGRHVHHRHSVRADEIALVRDVGSLIDGGQESIAPQRRPHGGGDVRAKHHEAGQVLVLGAEPVGEPGAHGWPAGLVRAGVHHQAGRLVIGNFRVDRAYPANIVRHFAQMRPELADVHAALPVFLELERRLHQLAGSPLGGDGAAGHGLAVVLGKHRLGIERIDGGEPAVHEEEDDALHALRVIELRNAEAGFPGGYSGSRHRLAEHSGERHHAEAIADPAQRFSASKWIS